MTGPDRDQRESPLVDIGIRAPRRRGQTRVVIHVVAEAVAEVRRPVTFAQGERLHRAPLRRQRGRLRIDDIARLVDVLHERDRLPAIEIDDCRVTGLRRLDRRIDRLVMLVRVALGLVRTVLQAVLDVALRDAVANGCGGAARHVRRGHGHAVTELAHQGVEVRERGPGAGRGGEPVAKQPIGGVADRRFARDLQIAALRESVHRAREAVQVLPREVRRVGARVDRPRVVHRGRHVKQVARMDGRPRQVPADRIQHRVVPQPRDRRFARIGRLLHRRLAAGTLAPAATRRPQEGGEGGAEAGENARTAAVPHGE